MSNELTENTLWDVIVIGGASAGLSAALMLGRARRRVLVIDGGAPRNGVTAHMHAVLGHDGKAPADLYSIARAEVVAYGVVLCAAEAVAVTGSAGDFTVRLSDGGAPRARRIVLATGLVDHLPEVPGLRELWGRSVFTCPYCDGYEFRDRRIGVLATGEHSRMQVQMLRQWSDKVVYLPHRQPLPNPLEQRALDARGIDMRPGELTAVAPRDGSVVVELADGGTVDLDVIFTFPTPIPRDDVVRAFDATRQETPFGSFLLTDPTGRTSIPGIWAAGNITNPGANVPMSIAAGAMAGAGVNGDLIETETLDAVSAYAQTFWEKRYRDVDPAWAPNPNVGMVDAIQRLGDDLPAGRQALELGCGHGGDALWLAGEGWTVTASDISGTALERVRDRAQAAGLSDRVQTVRCDITEELPDGSFDLITAAFTHLLENPARGTEAFQRILRALTPGGVLVLIDHGSRAPWMWGHGPIPTPEQIVAGMGLAGPGSNGTGSIGTASAAEAAADAPWRVLRAESVEREATGPNGEVATMVDNVVVVRRAGE